MLRTSVTACIIHNNTFSAPFGIFYVRTEIWKEIFQKKIIYKPLMGCSLFQNSHFQMGVTVMGFPEHFGQWQQQKRYLEECQVLVKVEEIFKFFRNSKIHSTLLMKGFKQICNGLWKKSHRRLCKNNYYKQDGKISGIWSRWVCQIRQTFS